MTRVLRFSLTARMDDGNSSSQIMDCRWNHISSESSRGGVVHNSLWYSRFVTFEDSIAVDPQHRPTRLTMCRTAFPQCPSHRHLHNRLSIQTCRRSRRLLTHSIHPAKRVTICDAITLPGAHGYASGRRVLVLETSR